MFSDTHFHLPMTAESNENFSTEEYFSALCRDNTLFAMDIGTKHDDLLLRLEFARQNEKNLSDDEKNQLHKILKFSAGLWPSVESIKNRVEYLENIRAQINCFLKQKDYSLAAIGECGIDHHWNPSGVDGRCENDFDEAIYSGEKELFLMQLELAKETNLPVIVHSRDGFKETLECIKLSGNHKGIIHCYSYGIEEAKAFLDEDYYISFSGSITYTKKSRLKEMEELIKFIPRDRILMETDSPYLSPVPKRGTPNSPLNVKYTYEAASAMRGVSVEELCNLVDENIRVLFAESFV